MNILFSIIAVILGLLYVVGMIAEKILYLSEKEQAVRDARAREIRETRGK
jgi:hypothetical protein